MKGSLGARLGNLHWASKHWFIDERDLRGSHSKNKGNFVESVSDQVVLIVNFFPDGQKR